MLKKLILWWKMTKTVKKKRNSLLKKSDEIFTILGQNSLKSATVVWLRLNRAK